MLKLETDANSLYSVVRTTVLTLILIDSTTPTLLLVLVILLILYNILKPVASPPLSLTSI